MGRPVLARALTEVKIYFCPSGWCVAAGIELLGGVVATLWLFWWVM